MGIRDDIAEYLICKTPRPPDEINAAIRRAVASLGKHAAIVATDPHSVRVHIMPGVSQKLSHHSPQVDVSHIESAGISTVTTAIVRYTTLQSKYLGLIPTGPKRLAGRSQHRKLLDALEAELVAIDHSARPQRRNRRAETTQAGAGR